MKVSTILTIILSISFIIIGITLYKRYTKNKNPNNEFIKNDKTGELKIFYASWCPHSQKSLKMWYTYKENYDKKYNISFSEIDCDKDVQLADSYNIDSYPTIILIVSGKKYIYDAEMNNDTLTQFINTIMK